MLRLKRGPAPSHPPAPPPWPPLCGRRAGVAPSGRGGERLGAAHSAGCRPAGSRHRGWRSRAPAPAAPGRTAPARAAVAAHQLATHHLIQGAHDHRLGRQGIGVVVVDLAAPQHMHRDGHPQPSHHRPALHRDLLGEGAQRQLIHQPPGCGLGPLLPVPQPAHQGGQGLAQPCGRLQGADRRRFFPLLHPGLLEGKRRKAGCSLEVAGGVQVGGWAGGSSLAMGRRWRRRSTLSATKRMSGFYAVTRTASGTMRRRSLPLLLLAATLVTSDAEVDIRRGILVD
jgi:hypothetical protein